MQTHGVHVLPVRIRIIGSVICMRRIEGCMATMVQQVRKEHGCRNTFDVGTGSYTASCGAI